MFRNDKGDVRRHLPVWRHVEEQEEVVSLLCLVQDVWILGIVKAYPSDSAVEGLLGQSGWSSKRRSYYGSGNIKNFKKDSIVVAFSQQTKLSAIDSCDSPEEITRPTR